MKVFLFTFFIPLYVFAQTEGVRLCENYLADLNKIDRSQNATRHDGKTLRQWKQEYNQALADLEIWEGVLSLKEQWLWGKQTAITGESVTDIITGMGNASQGALGVTLLTDWLEQNPAELDRYQGSEEEILTQYQLWCQSHRSPGCDSPEYSARLIHQYHQARNNGASVDDATVRASLETDKPTPKELTVLEQFKTLVGANTECLRQGSSKCTQFNRQVVNLRNKLKTLQTQQDPGNEKLFAAALRSLKSSAINQAEKLLYATTKENELQMYQNLYNLYPRMETTLQAELQELKRKGGRTTASEDQRITALQEQLTDIEKKRAVYNGLLSGANREENLQEARKLAGDTALNFLKELAASNGKQSQKCVVSGDKSMPETLEQCVNEIGESEILSKIQLAKAKFREKADAVKAIKNQSCYQEKDEVVNMLGGLLNKRCHQYRKIERISCSNARDPLETRPSGVILGELSGNVSQIIASIDPEQLREDNKDRIEKDLLKYCQKDKKVCGVNLASLSCTREIVRDRIRERRKQEPLWVDTDPRRPGRRGYYQEKTNLFREGVFNVFKHGVPLFQDWMSLNAYTSYAERDIAAYRLRKEQTADIRATWEQEIALHPELAPYYYQWTDGSDGRVPPFLPQQVLPPQGGFAGWPYSGFQWGTYPSNGVFAASSTQGLSSPLIQGGATSFIDFNGNLGTVPFPSPVGNPSQYYTL